jgi:hypothetical protein
MSILTGLALQGEFNALRPSAIVFQHPADRFAHKLTELPRGNINGGLALIDGRSVRR